MSSDRTADTDGSRPEHATGGRSLSSRQFVIGLAAIAVVTGFAAVLGFVLPALVGTETIVVAGITFVISPATMALYGAVGAGTFLGTSLLVLRVISELDENAA